MRIWSRNVNSLLIVLVTPDYRLPREISTRKATEGEDEAAICYSTPPFSGCLYFFDPNLMFHDLRVAEVRRVTQYAATAVDNLRVARCHHTLCRPCLTQSTKRSPTRERERRADGHTNKQRQIDKRYRGECINKDKDADRDRYRERHTKRGGER